ncbi:hypothetical protein [Prosthecomicrobium pneumaticum]|uniref:Uncharacterized protein n=1 Tax=Prosthecomicrobium pneumaticum TaxID=81895 RepID=A0A7W9CV84_9HYPH|nr:hypothetical protein [Prosthecomicrobium pneumaticum]MBB5752329.1 hypothetical protein [Prosthecomicrobium pneumaticum]
MDHQANDPGPSQAAPHGHRRGLLKVIFDKITEHIVGSIVLFCLVSATTAGTVLWSSYDIEITKLPSEANSIVGPTGNITLNQSSDIRMAWVAFPFQSSKACLDRVREWVKWREFASIVFWHSPDQVNFTERRGIRIGARCIVENSNRLTIVLLASTDLDALTEAWDSFKSYYSASIGGDRKAILSSAGTDWVGPAFEVVSEVIRVPLGTEDKEKFELINEIPPPMITYFESKKGRIGRCGTRRTQLFRICNVTFPGLMLIMHMEVEDGEILILVSGFSESIGEDLIWSQDDIRTLLLGIPGAKLET